MTKLLHEIWREDTGDCIETACCLAGERGNKARAMLGPNAQLLQVYTASSQFEAATIYNRILGFGPYTSPWEEEDSKPYPAKWKNI